VAGLGAEHTGQLALQLSLLEGGEQMTFLFDAGTDVESAAVLRRQVPTLGLRGKLFGATADAALLWRAADVIVARPRPDVLARVLLVGGKLVALVDDTIASAGKNAAAMEVRKRGVGAKGLLLLSSALESSFGGTAPAPTADGADQVADIVAAVAADKRGVVDERRIAAQAVTRDRVRAASAAANAAAATTAMPGELEDLGGDSAPEPTATVDKAEIGRLRDEVKARKAEMTKSMMASRDAATKLSDQAKGATARGAADEATQLERKADSERARMHSLLTELATLETELAELERVHATIQDIPPASSRARAPADDTVDFEPGPRRKEPPPASIDDALDEMKRRAGKPGAPASSAPKQSAPRSGSQGAKKPGGGNVDDELAALKKKMASAPPKKKP